MKPSIAALALSFSLLPACATPSLSKKGMAVEVLTTPIPSRCFQLGKIQYDGSPFINEADLTTVMKNLAAELGGNGVRMDVFIPGVKQVNDAKGRGTVFKCKPNEAAGALAPSSLPKVPSPAK